MSFNFFRRLRASCSIPHFLPKRALQKQMSKALSILFKPRDLFRNRGATPPPPPFPPHRSHPGWGDKQIQGAPKSQASFPIPPTCPKVPPAHPHHKPPNTPPGRGGSVGVSLPLSPRLRPPAARRRLPPLLFNLLGPALG